jgi:membrane dipeptidase
MTKAARSIVEKEFVFDGCVFLSDGHAAGLKRHGVDAINLTVSHFEADFEQAFDQIAEWHARLREPGSSWRLVTRAEDFDAARAAGRIGLVMGWQNMRPIADRIERLALAHAAGVRIMQLTYNRRNFIGDGCLEPDDGGLSDFGRQAVKEMNALGIAIDLSHVGERTAREAAESSTSPVLVTHANARAIVNVPRNKGDAVLKAVAAGGGVVGASIYGPMCWPGDPEAPPSLDDFLRQLDYLVETLGLAHVGLGTDLPAVSDLGAVKAITDMTLKRFPAAISTYAAAFGNDIRTRYAAGFGDHGCLATIVAALLERGWRAGDLAALLGGNFRRALREIWATPA